MTANAAKRLLQHYVDNFRSLPWRSPPGSPAPDPYRVWLSEVMLQQTTVAAVAPRFERFVAKWPTIESLAAASDEAILSEWAGLGYYARARNLIACARQVAGQGGFPTKAVDLRQLPGVGRYTSAAIASIAFGEAVPAVDTNVTRVIARLSGLRRPTAADIETQVAGMIPAGRAGDFAQAMMDLGATLCRPRAPHCDACPLRPDCIAAAGGSPEAFPQRAARRPRPLRHGIAWWIERDGHVWLVRRPAKGMLGGMAALPGSEWDDVAPSRQAGSPGSVRHVFTHFELALEVVERSDPVGCGWWHPLGALETAGLPTLYRRVAERALRSPGDEARATCAAA